MDEFIRAYLVCALWSSCQKDDSPFDKDYTIDDISPDSLEGVRKDCELFVVENKMDIDSAIEEGNDMSQCGHDFWLTRNRHGAGFWDGDYEAVTGERLTKSAHTFGEAYLIVGDDGMVHIVSC